MKNLILIILLTIFLTSIKAQITINSSDLPKANTVYVTGNDTISNTNIGSPSPTSQSWDFTGLVNHYPKVASYSPTTPYQCYAPSFPTSNIYTYGPSYMFGGLYGSAPIDQLQWGYAFWKTDATGLSIVGFRCDYGGASPNIVESPQELLMGTPASYDSTFYNTARWVATLNKVPYTIDLWDTGYVCNIHKNLTVDAFGTMSTVYGNFPVIRVHEYITEIDSAIAIFNGVPLPMYSIELLRDTINNYYFWTNNVGYPLASVFADKNNNVIYSEFLTDTLSSNSITGNVFKTNGVTPVDQGWAAMITKDPIDHLFGVPEIVEISNNGHFQFSNVLSGGNFLVGAKAEPTLYPHLIPTYYGDSIHWQTATTLSVTGDTIITINLQNDSTYLLQIGNSNIYGSIWADTSVVKTGSPTSARGVKITLEQNPGGAVYRHTETDENGNYSFTNLPAQNFNIIVEIPGDHMNSVYTVPLNLNDSTYYLMDYIYDSTKIYTYVNPVGISETNFSSKNNVNVFPNPTNGILHIVIDSQDKILTTPYNIEITDAIGRQIKSVNFTNKMLSIYLEDNLHKGMYFYTIKNGIELIKTGKIILE